MYCLVVIVLPWDLIHTLFGVCAGVSGSLVVSMGECQATTSSKEHGDLPTRTPPLCVFFPFPGQQIPVQPGDQCPSDFFWYPSDFVFSETERDAGRP